MIKISECKFTLRIGNHSYTGYNINCQTNLHLTNVTKISKSEKN